MAKTAVIVLAAAVCVPLFQEEDNPAYKHWAKYKIGTWVKSKSVTDMGAMGKNESETTMKLVEITDEKVVLEVQLSMGGMAMPASKAEIKAKIQKQEPPKDAPKPKEGDEEVEAAGKTYKCHWIETTTEQSGMKTTAKVWSCSDVPGQMVKMEAKTEGAMSTSTVMTLVEFKVAD